MPRRPPFSSIPSLGLPRALAVVTVAVALCAAAAGPSLAASPADTSNPAAHAQPLPCMAASRHALLDADLPRTAARLRSGQPLKIVALGSSSTAGAGASAPSLSYPNRLAVELLRRYPGQSIQVINRGVNGEEVDTMLARFERDVLPEQPDLVIWQLGTNAVFRPLDFDRFEAAMQEGIDRLRGAGIDVMVMDLQYAPRVVAITEHQRMLDRLQAVATRNGVPVFHRYALMRAWYDTMKDGYSALLSADGLHLNDASYGCLAYQVAAAVAGERAPGTSATLATDRPRAAERPAGR